MNLRPASWTGHGFPNRELLRLFNALQAADLTEVAKDTAGDIEQTVSA